MHNYVILTPSLHFQQLRKSKNIIFYKKFYIENLKQNLWKGNSCQNLSHHNAHIYRDLLHLFLVSEQIIHKGHQRLLVIQRICTSDLLPIDETCQELTCSYCFTFYLSRLRVKRSSDLVKIMHMRISFVHIVIKVFVF